MPRQKTRPAEFTYSAAERKKILKALPSRITEPDLLIGDITFWAWDARTLASWGALYGGPAQKQIRGLQRMATELRSAIQDLPRLLFIALDARVSDAVRPDGVKDRSAGAFLQIQRMLETLEKATEHYLSGAPVGRKTGAPGKLWLLFVGWELYKIYWRETGKRPTRRTEPYERGEYGPFRDFLIACMKPTGLLGSDSTVDALIRKLVSKPPISSRPSAAVPLTRSEGRLCSSDFLLPVL